MAEPAFTKAQFGRPVRRTPKLWYWALPMLVSQEQSKLIHDAVSPVAEPYVQGETFDVRSASKFYVYGEHNDYDKNIYDVQGFTFSEVKVVLAGQSFDRHSGQLIAADAYELPKVLNTTYKGYQMHKNPLWFRLEGINRTEAWTDAMAKATPGPIVLMAANAQAVTKDNLASFAALDSSKGYFLFVPYKDGRLVLSQSIPFNPSRKNGHSTLAQALTNGVYSVTEPLGQGRSIVDGSGVDDAAFAFSLSDTTVVQLASLGAFYTQEGKSYTRDPKGPYTSGSLFYFYYDEKSGASSSNIVLPSIAKAPAKAPTEKMAQPAEATPAVAANAANCAKLMKKIPPTCIADMVAISIDKYKASLQSEKDKILGMAEAKGAKKTKSKGKAKAKAKSKSKSKKTKAKAKKVEEEEESEEETDEEEEETDEESEEEGAKKERKKTVIPEKERCCACVNGGERCHRRKMKGDRRCQQHALMGAKCSNKGCVAGGPASKRGGVVKKVLPSGKVVTVKAKSKSKSTKETKAKSKSKKTVKAKSKSKKAVKAKSKSKKATKAKSKSKKTKAKSKSKKTKGKK